MPHSWMCFFDQYKQSNYPPKSLYPSPPPPPIFAFLTTPPLTFLMAQNIHVDGSIIKDQSSTCTRYGVYFPFLNIHVSSHLQSHKNILYLKLMAFHQTTSFLMTTQSTYILTNFLVYHYILHNYFYSPSSHDHYPYKYILNVILFHIQQHAFIQSISSK